MCLELKDAGYTDDRIRVKKNPTYSHYYNSREMSSRYPAISEDLITKR